MLRIATALIAMLSMAGASAASIVCTAHCKAAVAQAPAVCHEKAHAQMGLHMHPMNHGEMIVQSQESEQAKAATGIRHENSVHIPLGCRTGICVNMNQVRAARTAATHPTLVLSCLSAASVPGSPPFPCTDLSSDLILSSGHSFSEASAPLRI